MAACAAVLAAASAPALACVPQPLVTLRPRASGPAGSQVTVEALAVSGSQEIRWNAVDGTLLATATGPSFSVSVTIPPVDPGLYTVLVLERRPDGILGSTGRASYLVTGGSSEGPGATAPRRRSAAQSSAGLVLAKVGVGVALIALGSVGGAWLSRRRARAAS